MQKTCNLGERKATTDISSTTYANNYWTILYDGPNVVAEYNEAGDLLKSYIHAPGIDNPLAEITYEGGNETWHYYLKDGQGSISAITESDALAATVAFYDYTAFGSLIPETSSPAPEASGQPTANFMYTGREYNPESGDYYFRWRSYSPAYGRFTGADPAGYTDGWNLYPSYFAGNAIDPFGLGWLDYVEARSLEIAHEFKENWIRGGEDLIRFGKSGGQAIYGIGKFFTYDAYKTGQRITTDNQALWRDLAQYGIAFDQLRSQFGDLAASFTYADKAAGATGTLFIMGEFGLAAGQPIPGTQSITLVPGLSSTLALKYPKFRFEGGSYSLAGFGGEFSTFGLSYAGVGEIPLVVPTDVVAVQGGVLSLAANPAYMAEGPNQPNSLEEQLKQRLRQGRANYKRLSSSNASKTPPHDYPGTEMVDIDKLQPHPGGRQVVDMDKLVQRRAFDWTEYKPIDVVKRGSTYYVEEGLTRIELARRAGITRLPAKVR